MTSKFTCCFILVLFIYATAIAQPVITNCEEFTIGTVLKFQQCNATGVFAGSGGGSATWDFSGLSPLPDTSTEWMILPSATSHGSLYPTANMVEKYSDGTFVYVNMTADSSLMVGYVDSINNYIIHYPDPIFFALRPITYGASASDSFTINFVSPGFSFNGAGNATIVADGYGTLKLPDGIYSNTLRLKITQVQTDTSVPAGPPSVNTTVSYVWFDNMHTSGLLKIDSSQAVSATKSVEYLIHETDESVGQVNKVAPFRFYPNPVGDVLHISPSSKGVVTILNVLGQTMITTPVDGHETSIATANLPPGVFYLVYTSDAGVQTFRLLVIN